MISYYQIITEMIQSKLHSDSPRWFKECAQNTVTLNSAGIAQRSQKLFSQFVWKTWPNSIWKVVLVVISTSGNHSAMPYPNTHDQFSLCCCNVEPTSQTLVQHCGNIDLMTRIRVESNWKNIWCASWPFGRSDHDYFRSKPVSLVDQITDIGNEMGV